MFGDLGTMEAAMRRPNILIFMTDQQRGSTVLGDRRARLPNVEALAARGVRFANARCPSPHCCPSRASFMTGLHPSGHGVWNNVSVANALSRGLKPGVRTWSEDLAAAGYRCGWSGKWHVDNHDGPRDRGWEELVVKQGPGSYREGAAREVWQVPLADPDEGPGSIVRPGWKPYRLFGVSEDPCGDLATVDAAAAWLRDRAGEADEPWCLYVGTQGPHDPYYAPQRFLDLYPEAPELSPSAHDAMDDKPGMYRRIQRLFGQLDASAQREAARHYLALCSYEDWLFGRLMQAMREAGQDADTVVVYTSDHGDYAGDHGLWTKGLPAFLGAYDIPLVIAGPGIVAGTVVDDFVGHEDVAATIWDLAGLSGRGTGASLRPWLTGGSPDAWRDAWFTQSNGNEQYGIQRIVGERDWLYVYNGFDEDEFYDLRHDPHQLRNLAGDPRYAAERDRLCARMWEFAVAHGDECANGYIMVGLAPVGPSLRDAEARR